MSAVQQHKFRRALGHTWSPLHGGAFRDNKQGTIQDAGSSQACNYSSPYQHTGRVGNPTNQGTDFKDEEEA